MPDPSGDERETRARARSSTRSGSGTRSSRPAAESPPAESDAAPGTAEAAAGGGPAAEPDETVAAEVARARRADLERLRATLQRKFH
jgi:hypothetical protein